MHAITIQPGTAGSARLDQVEEPGDDQGSILVQCLATGICGTDAEIVAGDYGEAPEGDERLVLGHESLGRVVDPGPVAELEAGDLVVGIVRRPDPVPCPNCAVGEWDMCRNGRFTERGIKGRHGFMAERWRVEPDHAVKVDPRLGDLGVLLEPTSVVAKAWEQVDRVGDRAFWEPRVVLVTGAGPVGLLAAMIGRQRGLEVHLLDHNDSGPKPALAAGLGVEYHSDLDALDLEPDVVIEATGAGPVVVDAMSRVAAGGVVCLTGIGAGGHQEVPVADLASEMVLANKVMVGSVNANRRHYVKAHDALLRADPDWLGSMITRRLRPDEAVDALGGSSDDIKVVVDWS
jgi:threonine dehydrogenase-like Zn-dependent dehydrogenase